jgi:hypothetical protein
MGQIKTKTFFNDPLQYINAILQLSDLNSRIKELKELDRFADQLQSCERPNLELLAHGRVLASNTLSRKVDLIGWEKAQRILLNSIQAPISSASVLAARLNASLLGSSTNEPTKYRTSALYTADESYLGWEFIDEILCKLDQVLLSKSIDSRLQAFIAYSVLITAHPFAGGNGRTARLLSDAYLMQAGWLPVCYLSPIQSHVAVTYGGNSRSVENSIQTFLNGVIQSYKFALTSE